MIKMSEDKIKNEEENSILNSLINNQSIYNNYNSRLEKDVLFAFNLANDAKSLGIDGEKKVSIEKTYNLIERVIGLLSVFENKLLDESIRESVKKEILILEEKYGKSDWRVGMDIALFFSRNELINYQNRRDAIDFGIRFGFAYLTSGVVSSPIEGFTGLDIRKNSNGSEYFALNYAGPIRNAGGTAASVSVLIADYVRKKLNYSKYIPIEDEIERTKIELNNYHERVSNLQYLPSDKETEFFFKNCPIQIDGDPTSEIEVSSFKNIPRISTNRIRGGFCLVCSECLQSKAQKIKKKLDDWGKEMNMQDWDFLNEYVEIQKQVKSQNIEKKEINDKKIKENYNYLSEISAGKPVFSYPMKSGFRIRYGRTRISGYSCAGLNPVSMAVLDNFIAVGTQIKTERPFKGATITPCDSIEGPIVKLNNGNVIKLKTIDDFKKYSDEINKILHVGDILVNFGDFYNRNHLIIPSGYVEEWWIQDFLNVLYDQNKINIDKEILNKENLEIKVLEKKVLDKKDLIKLILKQEHISKSIDLKSISQETQIDETIFKKIFDDYLNYEITFLDSLKITLKYNIPIHPKHLFFLSNIDIYEYEVFIKKLKNIGFYFKESNFKNEIEKFYDSIEKLVIENEEIFIEKPNKEEKLFTKDLFEKMLIEHSFIDNKIILKDDIAKSFVFNFIKIKNSEIKDFVNSEMYVLSNNFLKENNYSKEYSKLFFFENKINTENIFEELNKKFDNPLIKKKNSIFMGLRLGRPEKAKPRVIKGGYNGLFTLGDINLSNSSTSLKNNFKDFLYSSSNIYSQKYYCEKCNLESPISYCISCGSNLEPIIFENKWNSNKNIYGFWEFDIKKYFLKFKEKYNLEDIDFENVKFLDRINNKEKFSEHYLKSILRKKYGLDVNKDGTIRFDATETPMTHFVPKEIGISIEKLKNLGYFYDIYGNEIINDNQIIELFPQDIILPDFIEYNNVSSVDFFFKVSKFVDELLERLYNKKKFYNLEKKEDIIGNYFIALSPHTSAGVVTRVIGFSKTQCLFAHPFLHASLRRDCDGDEAGLMLLMDGLLNFSKEFISNNRGSTMDRPLVLSLLINPLEIDDMVFDIDIEKIYSIDFYEKSKEYILPNKFKEEIKLMDSLLKNGFDYNQIFFTHNIRNLNNSNLISSYKYLPTMLDKVKSEVVLMEKLLGVDEKNAISLMLEKFFMKDMKGNIKKFFRQNLRCTKCNNIIRRPPLNGKCSNCGDSNLVFTIAPNSIIKYVDIIKFLNNKLEYDDYSRNNMEYLLYRINNIIKDDEYYQFELL
ncbi:MAG: hypothetical protein PHT94_03265 [Candidatus Nanoarchaeia archaeon]|nr:hypothetical protein [Candidatus Nanoarchaeia archaeon]